MTGDHRFEDAYNDAIQKEELNMCEVLDRVEQRGMEKGYAAGRIIMYPIRWTRRDEGIA